MPAAPLIEAVDKSATLRTLLLRYAQTLAIQTAYTALSNAVHQIDERLARWLLMCHDRVDGNDLALTHDFLSIMLAVRRPSVTTALHVLEGNGFIRSERGCIVVRNRAALEEFASDSYGAPEREYKRLIGPMC
jgi:CRP-like cAMP-binding protein